jgi:hypothetical protein
VLETQPSVRRFVLPASGSTTIEGDRAASRSSEEVDRRPVEALRPASEPGMPEKNQATNPTTNATAPEPLATPPTAGSDTAASVDYIEPPTASH